MMSKISKTIVIIMVVFVTVFVGGAILSSVPSNSPFSIFNLGLATRNATIATQTVDYINANLLQPGQTATLESFAEESGLIRITITVGGQTFNSYVTRNGKYLFPIDPVYIGSSTPTSYAQAPQTTQPATATLAKTDNSMLDAFIVSNCPFGLQLQRAMAEAVTAMPSLASHFTIRYIGDLVGNTVTSMHGPEEAAENLRQICIREEQPDKYWPYVSCYMKKAVGVADSGIPYGDYATCESQTGIDVKALNTCTGALDRGIAYAKKDFDLSKQYDALASPTLILNGATVSEYDFGGRSANTLKDIICQSSTNAPDFCSSKLNGTEASKSFSASYAPANSGSVASSNAGSACAAPF